MIIVLIDVFTFIIVHSFITKPKTSEKVTTTNKLRPKLAIIFRQLYSKDSPALIIRSRELLNPIFG